jgi:hypothetical protein
MKLIVAGSRTFDDYVLLRKQIKQWLASLIIAHKFTGDYKEGLFEITEIVSGCARGADRLGELYAKRRKIPIKKFPADWKKYGKRAGFLRNLEMAEYADAVILFWDGKSKGTKNMIEIAGSKDMKKTIVIFN